MLLETVAGDFQKARSVNATNTSFPSKVPTATEPTLDAASATGQATIDLLARNGPRDAPVQNSALLVPYGTGDDNDVFEMRAIGWRRIKGNPYASASPTVDLWVPVPLCELVCTMGAIVGVAGTAVVATERFCDTITLNFGNDDVSIDIVSPAEDVIAHVLLDVKGFQKLELIFDMTTGDPTSANCLVALL